MNSYKFNYRIEAIDKGLIPHKGFAPDSGYFEAIFDTATTINSFNNPNIIFKIYQNKPNPFNPTTTINYQIPQSGFVSLKIYDILGKEIATLVNEEKSTGSYEVKFDGSKLPTGIYFCTIKVGNFIQTKKMMLLK